MWRYRRTLNAKFTDKITKKETSKNISSFSYILRLVFICNTKFQNLLVLSAVSHRPRFTFVYKAVGTLHMSGKKSKA